MNEKIFSIALCLIPGVGPVLAKQLIAYFGSAEAVFKAPRGKLRKVPGIGEVLSSHIMKKETLKKAEEKWDRAEKNDTRILFYNEDPYPTLLKEISDAPLFIYWKGKANPSYNRSISIVGTRQCTEYGRRITEELITALSDFQPVIISGFAYGIDIIAHKAALKSNLPTIAVLGGGLNKVYPASHNRYVAEIVNSGAMVTEYDFDTTPEAAYFPSRNRIVAGMSQAVIVIEAAKEGGALITAELANNYQRDVFAVPGNIGHKYSEGCNTLISNHKAGIYTDPWALADSLGWQLKGNETPKTSIEETLELTENERKVVDLLKNTKEMQIDPLAWKSQMNINELALVLLGLELRGVVKALPGKKYTLC